MHGADLAASVMRGYARRFFGTGERVRLAREGIWAAGGQAVSAVIALVTTRLLTELVDPATFGAVALLLGVLSIVANALAGPLVQASFCFHFDSAGDDKREAVRWALFRLLLTVVILLSVVALLAGVGLSVAGATTWLPALLALGGLAVVEVPRSLLMNRLTAERRQKSYAMVSILDAAARPLLAIAVVLILGSTSSAVLLGQALGAGLGCFVLWHLLRRGRMAPATSPSEKAVRDARAEMLAYAYPLALFALVAWGILQGERYVVAGVLGLERVGVYAAASALASRPLLMLSGVLELTLRPSYYASVAGKDWHRERRLFWLRLLATGGGTLLAGGFLSLFSPLITRLLVARAYGEAAGVLPALFLAFAMHTILWIILESFYAYKRTPGLLFHQSVSLPFALSAIAVGASWGGLRGAAWGLVASKCLQLALAWWMTSMLRSRNRE